MDEFGKRAALVSMYTNLMEKISKEQKNRDKNQFSLFDNDTTPTTKSSYEIKIDESIEEFSEREKLAFEKELLGFFLTNHPLTQALDLLASSTSHNIATLTEEKEGTILKVGGILSTVKKILTRKSNAEMAFLTLEDHVGYSIECVVFPKTFESNKHLLSRDALVIVKGKLNFKDERPVVIVESISPLN
jgi:DNA polymerase-3 subunit alpha